MLPRHLVTGIFEEFLNQGDLNVADEMFDPAVTFRRQSEVLASLFVAIYSSDSNANPAEFVPGHEPASDGSGISRLLPQRT